MAPSSSHLRNPRRAPRVPLRLSVDVAQQGEWWKAETGDVGPGGCLVVSAAKALVERAPLRLVLRSDELRDALEVAGCVAWARGERGGVAFAPRQFGLGDDPAAWFKRLVRAQPALAAELHRAPEQLALDAPLFLRPAPRGVLDFAPDEVALLCHAEHGIRLEALLSRAGLSEARATRAVFSLFERNILTLSLGQAGEAWKWRAVLAEAGHAPVPLRIAPAPTPAPRPAPASGRAGAALPTIVRDRPAASPSPAPLSARRAAPPTLARMPTVAPGLVARAPAGREEAVEDRTLLRGVNPARRSAQAQARLDEALQAAGEGRIHEAVGLLRYALALSPRDPEISRLLGELAFKDRRR